MYWWLYPSRIVMFILLPIYLGCSWMSQESYAIYRHTANFIEGSTFWLGFAGLLLFSLGSFLAEPKETTMAFVTKVPAKALSISLGVLYAVTIAANVLFLFPIFINPQLAFDLAAGSRSAMFDLRDTLNAIPGVTSFVSWQTLCVGLHFGFYALSGEKVPRYYWGCLAVLVVLCLLRAWLWSERLAFIELVMPAVVVFFAVPTEHKNRWLVFAPLIGAVGLFLLFSVGEYFRSWQYYQDVTSLSFFEFVGTRFAGYYATALNNGAMILDYLEPAYAPVNVAQWFYKFPLWPLLDVTFENDPLHAYSMSAFLDFRGNAEYNNPSGIFIPLYDLGPTLGVLSWIVWGWLSGKLFNSYVSGNMIGRLLYPAWYIGVLEILRIFYWGASRFFPVVVAGIILAAYLQKKAREQQAKETA